MKLLQLVFDLTFLFISLIGAFLLRAFLPFGEPILSAPSVRPEVYVLLGGSWALLMIGIHRAFGRTKTTYQQLVFISAISVFSIFEFFILKSTNPSFSRLFLPLFSGFNLVALTISKNTSRQQEAIESTLRNLIRERDLIYTKLNDGLRLYYAEIIIALLASFFWVDYIIKMGLTFTSDSITYLESALKLSVDGELILNPHWPPFYPIIISSTKVFTAFPADGAAIISAFSVVIFFCFFALLLREYSRNALLNMLLIFLLASLDIFLSIFRSAWSEQLYSVLLIINFYLLVKHQKKGRYILFLGAALLAGLGAVTRYIGISMGLILILYTFIYREPGLTLKKRIQKYTAVACTSFLPLAILIAWNYSNRGRGVGYTLEFFSIFETTRESLALVWSNIGWSYLVPLIVLLVFAITSVFGRRKTESFLLILSMIFPVGYAALAIGAFVITSAHPQVRYFSPVYFFFFLSLAYLVDKIQMGDPVMTKRTTKLKSPILGFVMLVLLFTSWLQLVRIENILVDRAREARNNPIQQSMEGFNLSSTSQQLSRFFSQVSGKHSDVTVLVIEGDYDRRIMLFEHDFDLSKVFFSRSSIFGSAGFDRFAFVTVEEDKRILQFVYAGNSKELTFLLLNPNSIKDWLSQLNDPGLETSKVGNVYVIINELWLEIYAEDLFGNNLQALELVDTAKPYTIYQIKPNQ